jgi:hypothetical protein
MRWLLFAARVAFICNLFFLLCLVIQFTKLALPQSVSGFVIVVGMILSFIVNAFLFITQVIFLIRGISLAMPKWLLTFNLLCLIIQIFKFLLIP